MTTPTNDVHDHAPSRAWEPPAAARTPAAAQHRSRRRAAIRALAFELREQLWKGLEPEQRVDELSVDLVTVCDGPTLALLRAALAGAR